MQDLRRSSQFEVRKLLLIASKFGNGKVVSKEIYSGGPGRNILSEAKSPPLGVNKLSWEEMQSQRKKSLCFNCNERFTPGYKYKVK